MAWSPLFKIPIPDDYVSTSGDQIGLSGNKAWTGAHSFSESISVQTGNMVGQIVVSSSPGNIAEFVLAANSVQRWVLRTRNDPELGGNTGSSFRLSARADDGSNLHNVFDVDRATGVLDFGGPTPTISANNILHEGSPSVVKTAGNQSIDGVKTFIGGGPIFAGAATQVIGDNPTLQLRTPDSNLRSRIQYRAANSSPGPLNIDGYAGGSWTTALSLSPDGHLTPGTDTYQDIGSASNRWRQVFAVDGSINTSDAREKTEPRGLSEDEIAAALEIAKLPSIWQWHRAILSKGQEARLHCSPTVQAIIDTMESHNLDPFQYGFICYDEWEYIPEEVDERTGEVYPAVEAGNVYSLRHSELAMFVSQGLAHKMESIEAKLAALDSNDV